MNKKILLSFFWIVLTTALGSWWVYFSYKQYTFLQDSQWEFANQTLRYQRMLVYEGGFFLILVLAGGSALLYYTLKETSRLKEKEAFFSAFSHDLKTTITNLKITLEDILQKQAQISRTDLDKLFRESHRLSLQLENSLMLSRQKELKVLFKNISLASVISTAKMTWPELEVRLKGDVLLYADPLLLTSVISNIFQNAMIHGQCDEIEVVLSKLSTQSVMVSVINNGENFEGDYSRLGKDYFYRGEYKGSGLGLFICKTLMNKMKGDLKFRSKDGKFCADIIVQKASEGLKA